MLQTKRWFKTNGYRVFPVTIDTAMKTVPKLKYTNFTVLNIVLIQLF